MVCDWGATTVRDGSERESGGQIDGDGLRAGRGTVEQRMRHAESEPVRRVPGQYAGVQIELGPHRGDGEPLGGQRICADLPRAGWGRARTPGHPVIAEDAE